MAPFLIDDVFKLNENIHIDIKTPFVIIDNLFEDYMKIRDVFMQTPAPNWKITPDSRNFKDYYDCRQLIKSQFHFADVIRGVIKKVWNIDTYFVDNTVGTNWFLQINPKGSNYAVPHSDIEGGDVTVITYLNTEEECSGGTAFFNYLGKEKYAPPETGKCYWGDISEFEITHRIAMKPGMTLLFPSNIYHAAWHERDFFDSPRLNIVSWFKKNDTGKSNDQDYIYS
jgi:hypothetical protein